MSGLRVLMITQKVDLDDDILGFTHTWVNKLAERVERFYVLALAVGRHSLRDNVELFSMGKERGKGRLERLVNFNRVVAKLVLGRKVEVIFIHMCPRYAILAAPYAKLMRVPMVMWFTHRSTSNELRIAHWLVDKVVTASKESFRLKSDKVVITGHGIDTDRFKPLDVRREGNTKVILSVGRISPIKDYETLIEAANILVNKQGRRDLQFVIVGNVVIASHQGYFEHLQEMMAAYGLTDRVSFVGAVPHREMPAYYQECDVLVNLCPTGGLDKAVLEAMACGKIAITCNESFKNILSGYSSKLMFREKDAVNLADRIAYVLEMDKDSQATLGYGLRDIVIREHSVDSLMDRLVNVFEGIDDRARISPRIKWLLKSVNGERILDIGFVGEKEPVLHRKIKEVNADSFTVGLDINQEAVLRHRISNSVVGDASALPFQDRSFNAIILAEVLEHLYEPRPILQEIKRVLAPDGKFYLTTPNPYETFRWIRHWLIPRIPYHRANYRRFLADYDHKIFWEPLSLCNMLSDSGFEVTTLTTKNHRIPYLARIIRKAQILDLNFYPFSRLGGYTCIIAKKKL